MLGGGGRLDVVRLLFLPTEISSIITVARLPIPGPCGGVGS